MAQRVCIVGGGATGVALLWLLAKTQQRHPTSQYEITLVHDVLLTDQNGQPKPGVPSLGGHSRSVAVEVNGTEYWIDLGVQMIAPAMYPNLMCMLKLPEFSGVQMDPVPLRVSCAFPPDAAGGPARYWGNFPSYQATPLYTQRAGDAGTFESLMKTQPMLPTSLQVLLDVQQTRFNDYQDFLTYFLDPYLSIMNGYGAALLDQIYVPEAAFLFDRNYASFTDWSSNFMRFHYGAAQWVQTMAQDAVNLMPKGSVNIVTGASVTHVYPGPNGPSVVWEIGGNTQAPQIFDSVVLTTDMDTNGDLLLGPENPRADFYADYVGQNIWGLIPGYCYLHQDSSILAPGMPSPPEETLQFTAYWATQTPPFDLTKSWTTYSYKNLMGVADPDFEYYLTMYGFDPSTTPGVRVPNNPVPPTPMNWKHGMWLPSFMWHQKVRMRNAQGVSPYVAPLPTQEDTHIYFAGNNLTMDSEEGALVSAMAVARYAFNVDPLAIVLGRTGLFDSQGIVARVFYLAMYNLMFPGLDFNIADIAKSLLSLRAPLHQNLHRLWQSSHPQIWPPRGIPRWARWR
jgi:predicted NAD/FAD-binding protein